MDGMAFHLTFVNWRREKDCHQNGAKCNRQNTVEEEVHLERNIKSKERKIFFLNGKEINSKSMQHRMAISSGCSNGGSPGVVALVVPALVNTEVEV